MLLKRCRWASFASPISSGHGAMYVGQTAWLSTASKDGSSHSSTPLRGQNPNPNAAENQYYWRNRGVTREKTFLEKNMKGHVPRRSPARMGPPDMASVYLGSDEDPKKHNPRPYKPYKVVGPDRGQPLLDKIAEKISYKKGLSFPDYKTPPLPGLEVPDVNMHHRDIIQYLGRKLKKQHNADRRADLFRRDHPNPVCMGSIIRITYRGCRSTSATAKPSSFTGVLLKVSRRIAFTQIRLWNIVEGVGLVQTFSLHSPMVLRVEVLKRVICDQTDLTDFVRESPHLAFSFEEDPKFRGLREIYGSVDDVDNETKAT